MTAPPHVGCVVWSPAILISSSVVAAQVGNKCKYDLRKGDLFVLSWAMVRRVRRGSISSELLMRGGAVLSILLLPLVARGLETIDVCIWRMFVFMSVVVTVGVRGDVCCVAAVVKNSVFCLGVLKYVVCLCRGCDGCCVFCLYCEAWSCRSSCLGSVSVLSCICCMFVCILWQFSMLRSA